MVEQWVVTFLIAKNNDNFDANSISKDSPIRCTLEVHLKYPDELHALHNDYPLAPEKLAIPYNMLLGFCKKNCRQIQNKNW